MQITHWEYEELLEHLQSRPDIWTQDPGQQYLWLRTDTEGEALCGLQFLPPKGLGPYRVYAAAIVPISWSAEDCEGYLSELLRGWTGYGIRMRLEDLFITDEAFKFDRTKAHLCAIAIAGITTGAVPDPDREPTQPRFKDLGSGFFDKPWNLDGERIVFGISGGGYIRLSRRFDSLAVSLSLPSPQGGFSGAGQLAGHVRPRHGNWEETFAALFPKKETPGE